MVVLELANTDWSIRANCQIVRHFVSPLLNIAIIKNQIIMLIDKLIIFKIKVIDSVKTQNYFMTFYFVYDLEVIYIYCIFIVKILHGDLLLLSFLISSI